MKRALCVVAVGVVGCLSLWAPQWRNSSSGRQQRYLGDKYHPDKDVEGLSCTVYFANGTSAIRIRDDDDDDSDDRREGGYRQRGGRWWDRPRYNDDEDNDMPPPCRGSDDGVYGNYGRNDDDDNNGEVEVYDNDTYGHEREDATNPTPAPEATPAQPTQTPSPPTPSPTPTGTSSPSVQASTTATSSSSTTIAPVETPLQEPPPSYPVIHTPPPLDQQEEEEQSTTEEQPQSQPSEQTHYYSFTEEDSDDVSYVANAVFTAISVALPPHYDHGIPKAVGKAVTKFFNITSALRSEELKQELLEHAHGHSVPNIVKLLYPFDDIPYIIPPDQQLWFHKSYRYWLHKALGYRSLYWELVNIRREPIPVTRVPSDRPDIVVTINKTHTETIPAPPLAKWYVHPIKYRCYERDNAGNIAPILDQDKLDLIQQQIQEWLEFYVTTTHELFAKYLTKDHALGLALPGMEFDIEGDDIILPPFTSHSHSHDHHPGRPSSSDTVSTDEEEEQEDDAFNHWPLTEGTYREPLMVSENLTESTKQLLGWIVLALTISGTVLWMAAAKIHHDRREAQALWGTNVGTEQALQDLLNVGWSVKEQASTEEGPRQVLIIYDKAQQGYRDDDSMLQGGLVPPVFSE